MEDGAPENRYLLDKQTGDVLLLSAKTMGTTELLAFQDRMMKAPARYLPIPRTPSEEKYKDLEVFVKSVVKDKKLQEKLLMLLRGGNPVRAFLDAVDAHPAEKEHWWQFKTAAVQKRVDHFLKENGLS